MTISDDYRALNRQLHENKSDWGASARVRAKPVEQLLARFRPKSILDYGCGKGLMKQTLKVAMDEYDPCIPGKDDLPTGQYDMVLCVDVMEHVEPEYVTEVLSHISDLFTGCAYLLIYLKPAINKLPDGSNCHRTVMPAQWWLSQIKPIFDCSLEIKQTDTELSLVAIRDPR